MGGQPNRPKSPGYVYVVLSFTLFVLVAALALTARQPPPPSIAEFAPQAVEQITDSPNDQTSTRGAAAGRADESLVAGEVTPPPVVPIDVPRVRRCVGDPPRQIEDPQSPPCVPYWQGDNGGATSKGVTANEIRINMPSEVSGGDNQAAPAKSIADRLQQFFNSRFEFYGRRILILERSSSHVPENQRASAVASDEQDHIFAATDNVSVGFHYYDELAKRKIITAVHRQDATEEYLAKNAPYMWRYPIGLDRGFESMGRWACARLAKRPARFNGSPDVAGTRKFGVFLFLPHPDMPITTEPLKRGLATCGEKITYQYTAGYNQNTDAAGSRQAMVQMRSAGVNTMFYLGSWSQVPLSAASSQGYYPELITTGFMDADTNFGAKGGYPPDHSARMMGVTFRPKQVSPEETPAWQAISEIDPEWSNSGDVRTSTAALYMNAAYRALLLLASGIQMAGPRLTPETFERGLRQTVFPNPDHWTAPGKVSFANDHSMTEDAAEYYWSNSAVGPYNDDAGSICYVDGGARRRPAEWPSGDEPFFAPFCDTGTR